MATITSLTSASQDMLQASQKVWFQQTIWNKFGCPSVRHTSLQDLMHSTAILFASAKVAKYIVMMNQLIDKAVSYKRDVESANAHAAHFNPEEGFPTGTDEDLLSACYRLQLSNQTWFQLAVWNRFGSKSADLSSLKELELATAELFASAEVAEFIIGVNSMIDREMNMGEAEQADSAASSVGDRHRHTEPASPTHTLCSDTSSALSSHSDMGEEKDGATTEITDHILAHIGAQNDRKQVYGSLFGTDLSEASQGSDESECEVEDMILDVAKEGEEESEEEDEVVVLSSTVTPYAQGGSAAAGGGSSKRVKKESVFDKWFGFREEAQTQTQAQVVQRTNKRKPWTAEEEAHLAQLVVAHTTEHGHPDWKAIGAVLLRTPKACGVKYSQMKKEQQGQNEQKGQKEKGGSCKKQRQSK